VNFSAREGHYTKPEGLTGEDRLASSLKKALIERAIGAEMTETWVTQRSLHVRGAPVVAVHRAEREPAVDEIGVSDLRTACCEQRRRAFQKVRPPVEAGKIADNRRLPDIDPSLALAGAMRGGASRHMLDASAAVRPSRGNTLAEGVRARIIARLCSALRRLASTQCASVHRPDSEAEPGPDMSAGAGLIA
jgi:hypothetical protein